VEPVEQLRKLVGEFNEALRRWEGMTGCTSMFGWSFDDKGRSELRVREVVRVLYREPASDEELDAALLQFKQYAENSIPLK
jgi:hypothetical protein